MMSYRELHAWWATTSPWDRSITHMLQVTIVVGGSTHPPCLASLLLGFVFVFWSVCIR